MGEPGSDIARAEEVLERVRARVSPAAMKAHKRRARAFLRRLKLAVIAFFGTLLAAGFYGAFVSPLGIGGTVLAVLAAMFLSLLILFFWPRPAEPTAQSLAQADLPLLPQRTNAWLEAQRPALPAPAQLLVDGIGVRLEALGPQLQALDPREPAAAEVRKLIAEELPELVGGYGRVPQALRREGRNGLSPDRQLVEGLKTVDEELARMTEQLASGDLDKLATQNRYLELKYRGEEKPGE